MAEAHGQAKGPERRPTWWGWGNAKQIGLSADQRQMVRGELGETNEWPRPDDPGKIELPPAVTLPAGLAPLDERGLITNDHLSRLAHAGGKSFADLARIRQGRVDTAPDAVLTPRSVEEAAEAIEICSELGVTVIPFGGGTSVVGGVNAVRRAGEPCISLDLGLLGGAQIDRTSLTARLGPGLRGSEAEQLLAAEGLTLGHFPQSFEYATIGGFAATRSAGQASTGYGRFDSMITGLTVVTPAGEMIVERTPHTAAGPALRELMIGSEGAFGLITEVEARVRPAPSHTRWESWFFESFEAGMEAIRRVSQSLFAPDVLRLSDEEETRINLAMSGGQAASLLGRYLRLRGIRRGCMLIVGYEGAIEETMTRRSSVAAALRRSDGLYTGRRIGEHWAKGRYDGPYLRDSLLDAGVMVETLETAHRWRDLPELYAKVGGSLREALRDSGVDPLVFCHLSHSYPDGASLYFTVLAAADRTDPIGQWTRAKQAACEAIVGAGGTITHHHGVGADHRPWLTAEIGSTGVGLLRASKQHLDPGGIMNPGKLIPEPPSGGAGSNG